MADEVTSPSYTKVVVYFGFGLTSALRDPAVCHEGSSCKIEHVKRDERRRGWQRRRRQQADDASHVADGVVGYLVAISPTRAKCNCLF